MMAAVSKIESSPGSMNFTLGVASASGYRAGIGIGFTLQFKELEKLSKIFEMIFFRQQAM